MATTQISPHGFGFALGALSALVMLVMGLLAFGGIYMNGWEAMMQWHMWADLTVLGVFIGMLEGAFHGYVLGWLFAWFYNKAT